MFTNSIFGKFFEHGASLPPPAPPQGGTGLSAFGVCTPCCSLNDGDPNDWCNYPNEEGYRGRIAIINGGGIFPLSYYGINDLGHESWRGIVRFTHSVGLTVKFHEVDANNYYMPEEIERPNFTSNYFIPPNSENRCLGNNLVYRNNINWHSLAVENKFDGCGQTSYNESAQCLNASDPFQMCKKTSLQLREVDPIPDMEYEYYKYLDSGFITWRFRMRIAGSGSPFYHSNERVLNSNPYYFGTVDYNPNTVCNYNEFLYLQAGYNPISSIFSPIIFNAYGSYDLIPYGPGDSPYWNWIQPVHSNDRTEECNPLMDNLSIYSFIGDTQYNFTISQRLDSLSFSPVHASGYFVRSTSPISPSQNSVQNVFCGYSPNSGTLLDDYDPLLFTQYHNDSLTPKFAITVDHPFFTSGTITTGASNTYLTNNEKYAQLSSLYGNGFFRAVVPYPQKPGITPVFLGRTQKLSTRLHCIITKGESTYQCQLNLINNGNYISGLIGSHSFYAGQPSKTTFVKLTMGDNGYYTFSFAELKDGAYVYEKAACSFFTDLENSIKNYSNNCYDIISCCLDYNTWDGINCDGRISTNQSLTNQLVEYYESDSTDHLVHNGRVLNTTPMILGFSVKSPYKFNFNHDFYLSQDEDRLFGRCTLDSVEYTTIGVTITEI